MLVSAPGHAGAVLDDTWYTAGGGNNTSGCANLVSLICMWFFATGHDGAVLGDTWYIAGGGNNTSGCADLVSLDLSPLALQPADATPADTAGGDGKAAEGADGGGQGDGNAAAPEALTWAPVVDVDPRSAIASEVVLV